MKPLFSSNTDLVGWIAEDGFVFDRRLQPAAFVHNDHAFANPSCSWLGPTEETTLMDRSGKPVAFNPDLAPGGQLTPLQPLRPLRPLQPLRLLTPCAPCDH